MFSCCFGGGNLPKEPAAAEEAPAVEVKENVKEVEGVKTVEEDVTVDARDVVPADVVALVEPDEKVADAAEEKPAAVEEELVSEIVKEAEPSQEGEEESSGAVEDSLLPVLKVEEVAEESLHVSQPLESVTPAEETTAVQPTEGDVAPVVDMGDGIDISMTPQEPVSFEAHAPMETVVAETPAVEEVMEPEEPIAESEKIESTENLQAEVPTVPIPVSTLIPAECPVEDTDDIPKDLDPSQTDKVIDHGAVAAAVAVTETVATDDETVPAAASVVTPEVVPEEDAELPKEGVQLVESAQTADADSTNAEAAIATPIAAMTTESTATQEVPNEPKGLTSFPVPEEVFSEAVEAVENTESEAVEAVENTESEAVEAVENTESEPTTELSPPVVALDDSKEIDESSLEVTERDIPPEVVVADEKEHVVETVEAVVPITDAVDVKDSTQEVPPVAEDASSAKETESQVPVPAEPEKPADDPEAEGPEESMSRKEALPVTEESPSHQSETPIEAVAVGKSGEPQEESSSSTDKESDNVENGTDLQEVPEEKEVMNDNPVGEENAQGNAPGNPHGSRSMNKSGSRKNRSRKKRSNSAKQ